MMATKSKTTKTKGSKGKAAAAQKPAAKNGEPKKAAKPANGSKAKATKAKSTEAKRVSAIDAAAKVLEKSGKPMRSRELINAMAEQGLWTSPGGKTPWATLYSAMIREISTAGKDSRFKKVDRGAFAFNG
jgi:hypothetical protein